MYLNRSLNRQAMHLPKQLMESNGKRMGHFASDATKLVKARKWKDNLLAMRRN